jgi:pimeloyl-ACP methyl ester carboxylesterase
MRLPLSYTPPDLQAERPGTVRRRHVFFIPGYDPEARTRYRLLFVRELLRHAKRFGDPRPDISPAVLSPDGLVQSWTVGPGREPGRAATSYDVLLWDDLVARDFRRPRVLSVLLLVVGTLHALLRGLIFRFYRLNWLYGNVVIYPFVMVVLLTALSAAIGTMVHAHLGDWFGHSLGWPPWVTLPLAVVAGIAWIVAIEALLNRFFFWQLLNDWVFNWQHGNGWRRDYAERLEVFADRVLARIAEAEARGERPDEVMIVGHSTGGLTAAEVAARILARAPKLGADDMALALVTLGSGLPLVAAQPFADHVRAEVATLIASRRIVWLDVQAPQDWMNFPGFNPVLDLDLPLAGGPIANPLVRSAQVRDILTPETYAKVCRKPFRMHFQFLMSNERPGPYDYFRMVLGPQFLRDRAVRPIVADLQPGLRKGAG